MATRKPRISQIALAGQAAAVLLFLICSVASAGERAFMRADLPKAGGEGRYALVIGNSNYPTSPLKNPVNDAADVSKKLHELGFEVTQILNANKREMVEAIREFGKRLRQGGVGFFYYAGHAMQVDGNNYLVPIGADIMGEEEVEDESFDSSRLLKALALAENRLNLVVLDACRDNPFARSFRSSQTGLARMDAPSGTLVAFATSPGKTAADGDGRNGAYTKHLLAQMSTPGVPVEQMFKRVREGVMKDTGKKQVPWESSSLVGDFYFAGGGDVTTTPGGIAHIRPAAAPIAVASSSQSNVRQAGEVFRDRLKDDSQGPEMVVIPAGSFNMGSLPGEAGREDDEGPVHPVTIGQFALAKHELTVGEFGRFVSATNYRTEAERNEAQSCYAYSDTDKDFSWRAGLSWKNPGYKQSDDHPVVCVSYNDIEKYISWISEQTGKRYGLPSEAEWEYAARGRTTPTSESRYWGDNPNETCRYANVADKSKSPEGALFSDPKHECNDGNWYPAPVGSYLENPFGLKDMLGNVSEWTADCLNANYRGAPADGSVWTGGDCGRRVVRGGSWGSKPARVRSANRDWNAAANRYRGLGFRLAQDI